MANRFVNEDLVVYVQIAFNGLDLWLLGRLVISGNNGFGVVLPQEGLCLDHNFSLDIGQSLSQGVLPLQIKIPLEAPSRHEVAGQPSLVQRQVVLADERLVVALPLFLERKFVKFREVAQGLLKSRIHLLRNVRWIV